MFAAHGVEQQREVLDIARHRALHAEIAVDLGDRRVRDAADARPHADDAAEARGIAQRPPMSEPCASQAMPVASATAAPPEEPAAERDVFQGFRVVPNTSLKVLAPAPNSGVLDLA